MDLDTASESNAGTPEQLDFSMGDELLEEEPKSAVKDNAANEDGSDEDDDDESEEHEDDNPTVNSLTANEREILTLLAVDKKVASVLDLAATALSSLRAPLDGSSSDNSAPSQTFEQNVAEYYKALDDIQLTLRSSIHMVRKSRISPHTLMDNPPPSSVLRGGTMAPGALSKGAEVGKGAMRMEVDAWRDIVTALGRLAPSGSRGEAKEETPLETE